MAGMPWKAGVGYQYVPHTGRPPSWRVHAAWLVTIGRIRTLWKVA